MTDHCPTCGAAVRIEASGTTHYMVPVADERIRKLQNEITELGDENTVLRVDAINYRSRIRELEEMVESAYREGFWDGYDDEARPQDADSGWEHSDVRKQLERAR